ncbi:hypothetical protein [Glaesserella sp.]
MDKFNIDRCRNVLSYCFSTVNKAASGHFFAKFCKKVTACYD